MNRDHLDAKVGLLAGMEFMTQMAFHEAGHAAAIYFRNRYQKLPQISFRIFLQGLNQTMPQDNRDIPFDNKAFRANLKGGLLVESQVFSARPYASSQVDLIYRQACEADMVNLLAGPLAEAKHVAQRDGEHINQNLVNYDALKNYGGKSDQEKIEGYFAVFGMTPTKRAEKLKELHSASFDFINQAPHWRAISALAHYILGSEKDIIAYEEAVAILEDAMKTHHCFSRCLTAPAT